MTSRERILMALNLEGEPDKVPFMDAVDQRFQESIMGTTEFDKIEFAKKVGFDAVGVDFLPPLFSIYKEIDGMSQYVDGLIKTREDLEKMVFPDPDDESFYDGAKELIDRCHEEGLAVYSRIRLGASPTMLSIGMEDSGYMMVDEPELFEEIFDRFSDWSVKVVQHLNKLGVDFLWACDDLAFKTSTFVSPKTFREMFLPRMKRVADAIELPWIFHSDGNLMPILDDLLTLGMNCLHPIEPGAMDIDYMKETYQGKLALMGNIDLHYTLCLGTEEEVVEEVKHRLKTIAPGGGYIMASANSIPNYVKKENFLAMVKTVHEYRDYPIYIE